MDIGSSGEKATSLPNHRLGLSRRSVIRGGFVIFETLTFITFDKLILSSLPLLRTRRESPQSKTSSARSQTSVLNRKYPKTIIATGPPMNMMSASAGLSANRLETRANARNPNQRVGKIHLLYRIHFEEIFVMCLVASQASSRPWFFQVPATRSHDAHGLNSDSSFTRRLISR